MGSDAERSWASFRDVYPYDIDVIWVHKPIKPFGRLAHRQTRQYIYLGSTSADRTLVAGNGRRADAGVEGGRSSPQGGRRRRGPRGEDQNET